MCCSLTHILTIAYMMILNVLVLSNMTGVVFMAEIDLDLKIKFLRVFGDKTRVQILECNKNGEKTVSEIVDCIDGNQSNISQHLACLRGCGIIVGRKKVNILITD